MDGDRFDHLARRLAGAMSRRTVVRGLGASVLGGGLALLGRERSEAFICRQNGVLCAKDAQCCSGACDLSTHHCVENLCPPELPDYCDGECTNVENDKYNCGFCGHYCGSPYSECIDGQCYDVTDVQRSNAAVWRVLTDSQAMAEWGLSGNFAPVVGHRFQLRGTPRFPFDGVIEGEVLAVEAPHRLVFAWHAPNRGEPVPVTVELRSSADGSKTTVQVSQQSGERGPCRTATQLLGKAWQRRLLNEGLNAYVSRQRL